MNVSKSECLCVSVFEHVSGCARVHVRECRRERARAIEHVSVCVCGNTHECVRVQDRKRNGEGVGTPMNDCA